MAERPRLSVKLLWRCMLAAGTSGPSKVSMTSSGSAGAHASADGLIAVEGTTGTVNSSVWLARGSSEAGRADMGALVTPSGIERMSAEESGVRLGSWEKW